MILDKILVISHKFVFLFITFLLTFQLSLALYEFEVYRMFSYEEEGITFGSKLANFNMIAVHYSRNIARKLAIIHFTEITEEVLLTVINKKPGGLLIIMNKNRLKRQEGDIWKSISKIISMKSIHVPVYYCYENDEVMRIYNEFKENEDKQNGDLQFIVRTDEPKLLNNLIMEDFYGLLEEVTPYKAQNPSIMLIAYYDTFTPSPEFLTDYTSFGSGVIVLMNIMKEFYKLAKNNQKLNYNILFYLTSSKSFGLESLKNWLNKGDNSKYTNNIEYAFFLDSFTSANSLYLQIFNSENENEQMDKSLDNFLKIINQTSTIYETPFNILGNAEDILENKKIKFLSFSDNITPIYSKLENSLIIEDIKVSSAIFDKNLVFMTELIMKLALNFTKEFKILQPELNVESNYIQEVKNLLNENLRFPTYIQKDCKLNKEFSTIFNAFLKSSKKFIYTYQHPKFYSSKNTKLMITPNISPFIDLYLFFGIIAWFFVIYTFFVKFLKNN